MKKITLLIMLMVAALLLGGASSLYADTRHQHHETINNASDYSSQDRGDLTVSGKDAELCSLESTSVEMADGNGIIFTDQGSMFENGVNFEDRENELTC